MNKHFAKFYTMHVKLRDYQEGANLIEKL